MEKNIINFNKPNIEDGYSLELINYVDRLITKHPLIGVEGKVSLNYTGATYTFDGKEYAVFLLINRTSVTINNSFGLYLNWQYDGFSVYDNQPIFYNHESRGDLESNHAVLMMLEISSEQKKIVDRMEDPQKMDIELRVYK